ncbi:MAG: TetR/AcrR family transcriptional regulator C-terminal domain-containing protein [Planctomycetes bacterium]|nr:TetR/AcrR family transcriptional regulator C-terminal domain-containing protein [Planctomycetota bacterium]
MKNAGLTRERVLAAALALVDEQGLGQLSMRRLGEALGVEAMSLYRYVANKQGLLDGLHEAVLREVVLPEPVEGWEARLRGLTRAFRDALQRHPHTLPLFATRPAVAPASLDLVDAALGILEEAGLPADEQLGALHALVAFVVGVCQAHAAWNDPELPEVPYASLPFERYPNLVRLAPQIAAEDPDEEFAQGLELWIAGLRARLA